MNYSIVYSSKSGNTALLAQTIQKALPAEDCIWYGVPNEKAVEAKLIFIGFWTDKGSCDVDTAAFLEKLRGKHIFLFGTAGFGGSADYFAQILSRVQAHLDSSNTVVQSYLCQGKMPASVRQRYEGMLSKDPEKIGNLIENFDRALPHPDSNDLDQLKKIVEGLL